MTTGPGCDGVLTESDAHEVPCPHSETSRAARVSLTMRRIAPRRLSRLTNSRRTRRSAASLSAVPPSPLAEAAPSATRLTPMLVPSPNSTSSSRRRSVSGSVTCREATEVNSAVNPVTRSASLIRLGRSMMPDQRAISSFSAFRLAASGWRGMCGTLIHGSPAPGGDLHPARGPRSQRVVQPAERGGVLFPQPGYERRRVAWLAQRLVVHIAAGVEVGGQVIVGVAPLAGAFHPDLPAPDRRAQRHQDAQLVRDPLDLPLSPHADPVHQLDQQAGQAVGQLGQADMAQRGQQRQLSPDPAPWRSPRGTSWPPGTAWRSRASPARP